MRNGYCWLVMLGVVWLGSGCATIVSGTKQNISLASEPSGATAKIDGAGTVTTPAMVKLHRGDTHRIVISKEGYEAQTVFLKQIMEPWIWGNLAIGGPIGLCVDFGTGAAHRLKPSTISVILKPVATAASENLPEVEPAASPPAEAKESFN